MGSVAGVDKSDMSHTVCTLSPLGAVSLPGREGRQHGV